MIAAVGIESIHDLVGWWKYRLDRLLSQLEVTPLRISLLYTVLGFGALYVSDVLLVRLIGDPALLRQVQAAKGGVEIVLTAVFVLALTRQSRRSIRRTNARLEQQREELAVLHRVLRHNLRNDVNVLQGSALLLYDELESEESRGRCEQIFERARDVMRYTEQASKINDVAADDGDLVSYDLPELIGRMLGPPATGAVEIGVSAPESAPVEANHMLEAAIEELLANAVEHNPSDEPAISIEIDPEAGPPRYTELTIADNGPGIPDREKEVIRRRREDELVHSSGMGLWFAYWTVTMSGGEFLIDNGDSQGAVVRIRLLKSVDSLLGSPVASTRPPVVAHP